MTIPSNDDQKEATTTLAAATITTTTTTTTKTTTTTTTTTTTISKNKLDIKRQELNLKIRLLDFYFFVIKVHYISSF